MKRILFVATMVLFAAPVARADIIQFRLDGLTGDGLLSGNEGGLKNGAQDPGGLYLAGFRWIQTPVFSPLTSSGVPETDLSTSPPM